MNKEPERSFDGRRLGVTPAVFGPSTCELVTMEIGPDARSVIEHPDHVLLAAVAGGAEDVKISVDRGPTLRLSKLAGAAAFFPGGRRVESVWPAARLRYLLVTTPHHALEAKVERTLAGDEWITAEALEDPLMRAGLFELAAITDRPTNPVDDLLASAILDMLHLSMVRRHSRYYLGERGGGLREPLERAIGFIEDHLATSFTVADLCAVSGIPRARLFRAFRDTTGLPPHRYVVERRLDRAIELLLRTDLAVATVAARVGCASASHLASLLQRHRNVSPRAVRERARRS